MGRELKRKQAKREGKNVREVQKNSKEKPLEPKSFAIILVVLLLFFVILYIITGIFITKDIKWFDKKEITEDTNILTNRILAIDMLRQAEEEYYVYFYNPKDENSSVTSVVSKLTEKVYRVDLSDEFNSNYVGEEASGIVDLVENLKVVNPTLIKIVSGVMTEFYTDDGIKALG